MNSSMDSISGFYCGLEEEKIHFQFHSDGSGLLEDFSWSQEENVPNVSGKPAGFGISSDA